MSPTLLRRIARGLILPRGAGASNFIIIFKFSFSGTGIRVRRAICGGKLRNSLQGKFYGPTNLDISNMWSRFEKRPPFFLGCLFACLLLFLPLLSVTHFCLVRIIDGDMTYIIWCSVIFGFFVIKTNNFFFFLTFPSCPL